MPHNGTHIVLWSAGQYGLLASSSAVGVICVTDPSPVRQSSLMQLAFKHLTICLNVSHSQSLLAYAKALNNDYYKHDCL
eukprot:scaffold205821_cov24-Prasinocladus_malaysianus.AAC.3